jgi:hypothetical protein
MNKFTVLLRREMRVALSLKAQPVWFRVLKWSIVLPLVVWLWPTRWFWPAMLTMLVAGLTLHFFFRWKTAGWSRPWAGWDDVKSADGRDGPL